MENTNTIDSNLEEIRRELMDFIQGRHDPKYKLKAIQYAIAYLRTVKEESKMPTVPITFKNAVTGSSWSIKCGDTVIGSGGAHDETEEDTTTEEGGE